MSVHLKDLEKLTRSVMSNRREGMMVDDPKQDVIATWFVADTKDKSSFFPQAGIGSSSLKFQEIYWRCVACFFATSARIGHSARHILFTNVGHLPLVDGVSLERLLNDFGVEVRTLPITHRLGREKVSRWNNQFYILDIIDDLCNSFTFKSATVLDSDCVWVRRADRLFTDIKRRGILSLCIPYAADLKVNGGSRRDMRRAAMLLANKQLRNDPYYCGGELFAADSESVKRIHELAKTMWSRLQASAPREIPVYEEGHFLSIIYELLDVPIGTADPHIRRMWTALRLYNVSWEDIDSSRCVWHLPTEKKTGFVDLFSAVRDANSWFWQTEPEQLRLKIAAAMGIPNRTTWQWAKKVQSRTVDHLEAWYPKVRAR